MNQIRGGISPFLNLPLMRVQIVHMFLPLMKKALMGGKVGRHHQNKSLLLMKEFLASPLKMEYTYDEKNPEHASEYS